MENLSSYIEFAFYVGLGYLLYKAVSIFINGFRSAWKEAELRSKPDLITKKIHVLKVERIKDIFYWFDAESEQFIAQGRDIYEFVSAIKQVHPEKVFLFNDYCFAGPDFMPVFIKDSPPPEVL